MAASTRIEIVGLKEAVRALNSIEPGLRREFTRQAGAVAKPVIAAARGDYPDPPLSGMRNRWRDSQGREILPWDVGKARRGLRVKVDTRRKARNVILIQQADRAGTVYEAAGRRTQGPFARALGPLGPFRTRVLGQALSNQEGAVERALERLALDVVNRVDRQVR